MRLLAVALALSVAVAGSGAAVASGADARRTASKRCLPFVLAVKPKRCSRYRGARSPIRVQMGARTPAATPPANPTPPAPTPAPAVARLGVTAREWSLVLSRAVLAAGPARVQLQNLGEDAHNLRIERVGGSARLDVPLAEAGERSEGKGTLTAGTYRVYCALPGHEAAGMRATLSVR